MQTSLETKSGLKRSLKVILPAETFKNKHKEILGNQAKKAKIQGFRPGKAPLEVVAKQFGSAIAEQAIEDLISTSLRDAFEKEKVVPVNRPSIESLQANEGQDFEYVASFEVAPVVETVNFDGVTLETVTSEITAQDVDQVVENLTKQFGHYVAKETGCENNDRVTIDFEGSIDGVKFDGGTAEKYAFVLGQGQMIPDFETGIMGMKAGEEKIIDVKFPENYHADLAGKTAQFKIKLHQVESLKAAEINEELVKRLGVASGDLSKLRGEIEKTLSRELKRKLRQDLHQLVFNKLAEMNPMDLPESVVHEEIHHLMHDAKERFQKMTGQKNVPDFPHDMFEPQAKQRVTNSYLILKIIEQNQLKADAAKVRILAEDMAAAYENPEQVRDHFLGNREQYQNLENLVLEDAVVDFLLSKATVKATQKAYKEVMGKE